MNYIKQILKKIKCRIKSCCGCKSSCGYNDDLIEDSKKDLEIVKDIYL